MWNTMNKQLQVMVHDFWNGHLLWNNYGNDSYICLVWYTASVTMMMHVTHTLRVHNHCTMICYKICYSHSTHRFSNTSVAFPQTLSLSPSHLDQHLVTSVLQQSKAKRSTQLDKAKGGLVLRKPVSLHCKLALSPYTTGSKLLILDYTLMIP